MIRLGLHSFLDFDDRENPLKALGESFDLKMQKDRSMIIEHDIALAHPLQSPDGVRKLVEL